MTVRRAVARLVAEGLLTTRPGVGTFVSRPTSRPSADTAWQQVTLGASPVDTAGLDLMVRLSETDALQLASGRTEPAIRPDGRIAAAMARAARRPNVWAAPPQEGLPELRAWFASETGVDQDDVFISPGGQGAMSSTMRALLPSASPVLFAVPTYPGALAVARSAGLIPVPVPTDSDGVRPDLLARAFATTSAKLLYLQPTFANPDGGVLAQHRRQEVLETASAAGAFILEDDWARWLSHHPPAPPPLIRDDVDGHVVTVSSLPKPAAASLRVGAIMARGPVLQRIAAMRLVDDFYVCRPLQEAAIDLVTSAGWQAHLRSLSATLRHRAGVLAAAVATHMPACTFQVPAGGMCMWLRLPRHTQEDAVVDLALASGVAVTPGRLFVIGEPEHPRLRLSFAAIDAHEIDEAVRRLAEAVGG